MLIITGIYSGVDKMGLFGGAFSFVDDFVDDVDSIGKEFGRVFDDAEDIGAEFINEALFGDLGIIGGTLAGADAILGTELQKGAEITLNPHKRREFEREIADQEAQVAQNKETQGRDSAYRDALEGKDIDSITRAEILKLHSSGASSTELATLIAKAREGEGIFGIRKITEDKQKRKKDRPGRSQLLGTGSIL